MSKIIQVLNLLESQNITVTAACKNVGVSKQYFYAYLRKNKLFKGGHQSSIRPKKVLKKVSPSQDLCVDNVTSLA